MLRNLVPSVRSSTTSTSVQPRSFRPLTKLLPMKPAPPVTIIMIQPSSLLATYRFDHARRRNPIDIIPHDDRAAVFLHAARTGDVLNPVVAALDQHIRQNSRDQPLWRVF